MRRLLVLCSVLVVLPVAAVSAREKVRHHTSAVTIQYEPTTNGQRFLGKVTGGPTKCRVDRRVHLLLGGPGVKPKLVGTDWTSSSGDWFISLRAPLAGYYRAVAVQKTYKANGVKHVCDAAKSPRVQDV